MSYIPTHNSRDRQKQSLLYLVENTGIDPVTSRIFVYLYIWCEKRKKIRIVASRRQSRTLISEAGDEGDDDDDDTKA